jgi:hypothetical protein
MHRKSLIFSLVTLIALAAGTLTIGSELATAASVSNAVVVSARWANPPELDDSGQALDAAGYRLPGSHDPAGVDSVAQSRVRAEIPSDFMQPVGQYNPSEVLVDSAAQPIGPHSVRDEIPSEFIYPLAFGTVHDSASPAGIREKIPSDFIQPVVPSDPAEASPDAFVLSAGPQTVREEIPSDFIQPVAPHNVRDEIPSEFIQPVAP